MTVYLAKYLKYKHKYKNLKYIGGTFTAANKRAAQMPENILDLIRNFTLDNYVVRSNNIIVVLNSILDDDVDVSKILLSLSLQNILELNQLKQREPENATLLKLQGISRLLLEEFDMPEFDFLPNIQTLHLTNIEKIHLNPKLPLKPLILKNYEMLSTLILGENFGDMFTLDIISCPNLTNIIYEGNEFITNSLSIKLKLQITNLKLPNLCKDIELNDMPNIQSLEFGSNFNKTLNLSKLKNLESLKVDIKFNKFIIFAFGLGPKLIEHPQPLDYRWTYPPSRDF